MKGNLTLSSYCAIIENQVIVDGNLILEGRCTGFPDFSLMIYKQLSISYPKFHKMDDLCKLGFLTSELLLRNKYLLRKYQADEIGIIFMNASSSLVTDHQHQTTINDRSNYFPSPSIFVYTLPNVVIGEICIRNKFSGEGNFLVLEKFDADFLENYINHLLGNRILQCCLCGWVELNGNDFESVLFLAEKSSANNSGIANFESRTIQTIYDNIKSKWNKSFNN